MWMRPCMRSSARSPICRELALLVATCHWAEGSCDATLRDHPSAFGWHYRQSGLLIQLRCVGRYPIHRLTFGREAIDAPLVAVVISDNDVPTRPHLVLEGQHDRFFVGLSHAGIMDFGRLRFHPLGRGTLFKAIHDRSWGRRLRWECVVISHSPAIVAIRCGGSPAAIHRPRLCS